MTGPCPRCGKVCGSAPAIADVWRDRVVPSRDLLGLPPDATGRGVTVAIVDAGFYPHTDLILPINRIRAWADASFDPVRHGTFEPGESPRWPGWDAMAPAQWHGLMTSAVVAGNGWMSHGLFAGPACGADLVLVQVRQPDGRIGNATLARALRWLAARARDLRLRVVSLSVGGDPGRAGAVQVHAAVRSLVAEGVVVLAAAGNEPRRGLVPPASSPAAITVGAFESRPQALGGPVLWRSSWGGGTRGVTKPEVIAPGAWIPAPMLPGIFRDEGKTLIPGYHHTDGTSVSVSLAAGVVACMMEVAPGLDPAGVKTALMGTARRLEGPRDRQGSGAIDAMAALRLMARGA